MTTSSVLSGQTQSGLMINGGAIVDVLSGGTLTSATILAGGSAVIESGAVDSGTYVSAGGSELIYGSANGDTIAGLQTVSTGTAAGIVTNETVVSGGVVYLSVKTTSASNITMLSGGALNINGAISATNITLSGGTVNLESAKATLTGSLAFVGGGTLEVTGNTSVGSGDLAVISGFGAGDVIDMTAATTLGASTVPTLTTTVSGGNTVATVSGGGVSDTYIFAGTTIGTSLTLVSDGAGGQEIVVSATGAPVTSVGSGMTLSNQVVSSGATLTVTNGGTAVKTTVLSGGTLVISSGGVDSGAMISVGGSETLIGSASADSIYGTQTLSAGTAVATGETVQSGGSLSVVSGTASGTVVSSGGTLNVSDAAANTTIAGGTVNLLTPQATLSGSFVFNGAGTLDIGAISSTGAGDQAVISGFYSGDVINLTTIGSGATLSTTVSGGSTVATVTSGGVSETLTFSGSVASSLKLTSSGGVAEIAYAGVPTTTSYTPGDLVLSIYGNGAGTGTYTLDQAAPITLEEITTTGQIVSIQVLPQTTTVVNGVTEYAISGEYQSASEGLLTLSGDGQSLTILGYGVTATVFDAANAATVYGTTALGQTTSLAGTAYMQVTRVVADISYNGTVDTSTSLSGVFNTNNPRSVYTINGTTFYLSGQGNGTDGTEGVFLANDGASNATAIYNIKADTREVAIYNGQLYVSVDSKANAGAGIYSFGSTLPTSATTPTQMQGLGASIVLAAGQANSVNASAVGTSVNLSPEQYFFANATTLYVADGGVPKEGGIGDGGLQKWSLVNGTWVLDYTLSTGLNIVSSGGTATTGTTGLVGLTGTVEGGNVILYATNETAAETDQTYLYGITDALAATTLPTTESFTLLETAAPDTLIRGVAFAPTASATVAEVTSTVTVSSSVTSAGLTVANGGSIIVLGGGTIAGTTLLSGAATTISSGGVDSATFVAHGATETVLGAANLDIIDGTQIVSAATAVVSNEIVENGGTLDLFLKGATASGTTVNSGGTLNISGNAFAVNTTVSGGAVVLESPKAVLSGTFNFAGPGGTIEATVVTSAGFGDLAVISGFGAGDAIDERAIGTGATLSATVSGGNVVATITSGTTVESFTFAGSGGVSGASYASGLSLVSDGLGGEELLYTPPAPVNIIVSSGVTSSGLSVTSGNSITVMSGGTMSGITILSGGSAVISAGGADFGSTVQAGGIEIVSGDANGDQVYGILEATTGGSAGAVAATIENATVYNGGTVELYLKPDLGTGITVSSGGALLLSGNVSATNIVLGNGAYMALQSPKAVINGGLTFSGAATIAVTAVTSAGFGDLGVISGWQAGDVIDETLINAASASLSTTISGGNTVATISGAAFPESFIFAGTTVASNLVLVADGTGGVELVYEAACMATGTLIATEDGDRAIETLQTGENVVTATGALRPVRWVGYRSVDLRRHPRPHDVMPVRVQAHALAAGCPARDLILSPDHALFIDGALVPVRYLINGTSVAQETAERITWWHVELDTHDVIYAEGMPTESYLDTGNRGAFTNAGPEHVIQAHPKFARGVWEAKSCAPLVTDGPVLASARQTLLDRLPALGHVVAHDPDLRFAWAGQALQPQQFGEWVCLVTPQAQGALRLRSRTVQPAALECDGKDWRVLGVALEALRVDGDDVALDAPCFAGGWLEVEPGLRWSTGDATLHVPADSVVEMRFARFQRYAVPAASARRATAA